MNFFLNWRYILLSIPFVFFSCQEESILKEKVEINATNYSIPSKSIIDSIIIDHGIIDKSNLTIQLVNQRPDVNFVLIENKSTQFTTIFITIKNHKKLIILSKQSNKKLKTSKRGYDNGFNEGKICDIHENGDPECIFTIQELEEVILEANHPEPDYDKIEEIIWLYSTNDMEPHEFYYLEAIGWFDYLNDYYYVGSNNSDEDDDKIDNELTGKADCVYQKMVDSNNNINWILENFEDSNQPSQFNLKFVMSTTLGNETNASFATPFQSGIENTFVISINQNTLSDRTSLGLARTILHEGVHARLWEFMYSRDKNLALIKNDFPGIYDYYREHKQNWDHEQMAEFYRETIAQGLKQFDNGQHSDAFYDALAWEGLAQYKDANNNHELIYSEAWKKLTPNEQQEILNTITDEKQNGSKECN